MKRTFSYLLMIAGSAMVFLATRDLIESHTGQTAAAKTFVPASSKTPVPIIRRGDTVAKLSIPRLGASLYVVEGDEDNELRRGPGHLSSTPMPGENGNSVIAGHRDTHFRVLKDIHKGDDIMVETPRGQFLYRVRNTSIVLPTDTRSLKPTGDSVLHLITCYPFYYVGSAPQRFVVEARLAGRVTRLE